MYKVYSALFVIVNFLSNEIHILMAKFFVQTFLPREFDIVFNAFLIWGHNLCQELPLPFNFATGVFTPYALFLHNPCASGFKRLYVLASQRMGCNKWNGSHHDWAFLQAVFLWQVCILTNHNLDCFSALLLLRQSFPMRSVSGKGVLMNHDCLTSGCWSVGVL